MKINKLIIATILGITLFSQVAFAESDVPDYGDKKTAAQWGFEGTATVPYETSTYVLKSDGFLYNTKLENDKKSINTVLSTVSSNIASDLVTDMKSGVTTPQSISVEGLLRTESGYYMGDPLTELVQKSPAVLTVPYGKNVLKIYVPQGKDTQTGKVLMNTSQINAIKDFIAKYDTAVKKGILSGSSKKSVNVYTAFSSTPIAVGSGSDLIIDDTSKDGTFVLNKAKSSDLKFNLDYFMNPVKGKVFPKDAPRSNTDWETWLPTIKYTVNTANNTLVFDINQAYLDFVTGSEVGKDSIKSIDGFGLTKTSANGVLAYSVPGFTATPYTSLDYKMRVILPKTFNATVSDSETKTYETVQGGYVAVPNIRLSLSDFKLYDYSSGKAVLLGGIDKFGSLTNDDFAFYNYTSNGKSYGALLPLKYQEGVYDVNSGSILRTGRELSLGESFTTSLTLSGSNKGVLDISSPLSAKEGVPASDFAFPENADYTKEHIKVQEDSDTFDLISKFQTSGVKGIFIIRNNNYIADGGLLTWLESSEAKSDSTINMKRLKELINGDFSVDAGVSFDEWARMQVISSELAALKENSPIRILNIVVIIFGIFVIFYGVFLVPVYFIDIYNVFTNISILSLMTGGRLHSIASLEEMNYLVKSDKTTYVTLPKIIIRSVIIIIFGGGFVASGALVGLLIKLYLLLNFIVQGGQL